MVQGRRPPRRHLPQRHQQPPLAARTNRQIGGRAPSEYQPAVEKAAGVDAARLDEILRSHCVEPALLRGDDFWAFFAERAEALLQRIEAATGKDIPREPALFQPGAPLPAGDEEIEDAEESEGPEEPEP